MTLGVFCYPYFSLLLEFNFRSSASISDLELTKNAVSETAIGYTSFSAAFDILAWGVNFIFAYTLAGF